MLIRREGTVPHMRKRSKSYLTFTEVQSYLGVKSRKTILKYIKSGGLSAFKLGGTRWRFSQEDLDNFLNAQRPPAWHDMVLSASGSAGGRR